MPENEISLQTETKGQRDAHFECELEIREKIALLALEKSHEMADGGLRLTHGVGLSAESVLDVGLSLRPRKPAVEHDRLLETPPREGLLLEATRGSVPTVCQMEMREYEPVRTSRSDWQRSPCGRRTCGGPDEEAADHRARLARSGSRSGSLRACEIKVLRSGTGEKR